MAEANLAQRRTSSTICSTAPPRTTLPPPDPRAGVAGHAGYAEPHGAVRRRSAGSQYLPGDTAAQNSSRRVLANRSQLHVEVLVDESDVSQIRVGNPSPSPSTPLPDLTLGGT